MFPPKGDQGCVKTASLVGFTVPDGTHSLVSSDPREVVKWLNIVGPNSVPKRP